VKIGDAVVDLHKHFLALWLEERPRSISALRVSLKIQRSLMPRTIILLTYECIIYHRCRRWKCSFLASTYINLLAY